MLTIRTICAKHPHDGKEWKEEFVMVYPYYGEKRYINEKRLFNNSHEKRFFDAICKSSFLFRQFNIEVQFVKSVNYIFEQSL